MQNVDTGYKRESLLGAFVSLELVVAVVCMATFWFTIPSFDAENAPATSNSDSGPVNPNEIMAQANCLHPMVLANSGNLVEATREAATLVQKKGHDVLVNICAGNVFCMAGAGDDGLKYLKKAVALSRRNKQVVANYAQRLEQFGHTDEAIVQYNAWAKMDPSSDAPHMALAKIYLAQKNPDMAAQELGAVVELNNANFAARKLRGIALARAGKLKPGLEEYMLANAQESQSGPPDVLKQMLGNSGNSAMDRVIYEMQQQVNQHEAEYVPKLRLAQLYIYGGNAKDAKELLLDARRLAPNNAEVQRTLAVALKQLGEDNQALSAFGLSVKLEEAQERERAAKSLRQ